MDKAGRASDLAMDLLEAVKAKAGSQPLVLRRSDLEVEYGGEGGGFSFTVRKAGETIAMGSHLPSVGRRLAEVDPDAVIDWHFQEVEAASFGDVARWFFAWVDEGGGARTLADLAISRIEGEERRYEVRNALDIGRPAESLRAHAGLAALREFAETDRYGRLRPLRTGPDLGRGWLLKDLGPTGLIEAVEAVYPTVPALMYLEAKGLLPRRSFREAARRDDPSGTLADLPVDVVRSLAVACCAEDVCRRRLAWSIGDEEPLEVEGASGPMPCPEPCPIFLNLARVVARLDRAEAGQQRVLRLLPHEAHLVDLVLKAAATGTLDEALTADFDDPRNRRRVRYFLAVRTIRAKAQAARRAEGEQPG